MDLVFCSEATADSHVPMHLRSRDASVALCGTKPAYDLEEAKPTPVLIRRLHVCAACRKAVHSAAVDV